MAGKGPRPGGRVALGLRAVRGGAVAVGVTLTRGEPRVVSSSFLATGAADDRLSFEPYHVAAEMARAGRAKAEIAAAVALGRKRQDKSAAKGLAEIVRMLSESGGAPSVAALLVNRAGWVDDLLAYSLAFADHPPVAEGLAVREALRHAAARADVVIAEVDEKSLADLGSEVLDLKPAALDARLKALGAGAKPWRKEQKLACLAAWVQLAKAVRAGLPV